VWCKPYFDVSAGNSSAGVGTGMGVDGVRPAWIGKEARVEVVVEGPRPAAGADLTPGMSCCGVWGEPDSPKVRGLDSPRISGCSSGLTTDDEYGTRWDGEPDTILGRRKPWSGCALSIPASSILDAPVSPTDE